MSTPAETVKAFNDIFEHPRKGWLTKNRKERLKATPVSTLAKALLRRIIFFLVKLRLFPTVIPAKTLCGTVYAPIWGALPLIEKGFNGTEIEDVKLTKFIVDTLKPGQIFVDGGAYYGWYSILADALGAKVYSFEPTNKIFEILSKNAKGKNITPYRAALWSSRGEMEFHDFGSENNVSNTLNPARSIPEKSKLRNTIYKVKTISLDDIPRADFIKLDCEGVEYEILSAAKKALEHKPILAVEFLDITRKSGEAEKTVNLLKNKGYRGYYVSDDFKLAPLEEKEEAPMVNAIFLPNN